MDLSDLQKAHDYTSLARLFGVSPAMLKANLYSSRGYWVFDIPKKSGGFRRISAPTKSRKALQKALLPVLVNTYRPNLSVHGFVANRSIETNARKHVGRRTVLNVDLRDFFPTISFQRIRGVFLAPPFRLSWTTANIVAQVCCDQGVLPAGGVTSPSLSNIVCARMDKRLSALCQRLGGLYTRYADDMTMSFDRPLAQLTSIVQMDERGEALPGKSLTQIISEEGFSINLEKLRVSTNMQRKVVTGLVVNERVNVRRAWYLNLESLCYAARKFGLASVASAEFPEESDPNVAVRRLLRRLHGRLAYYQMVRGNGDWLLAELANRFNALHSDPYLRVPDVEAISKKNRLGRGVLIVAAYEEPMTIFSDAAHQGSGFISKRGLIVTAAHVLLHDGALLPHVYVMNERKLSLHECDVLARDETRDVAILRTRTDSHDLIRCRFKLGDDLIGGDHVDAVGFPGYEFGDHHVVVPGLVTRSKRPVAGLSAKIALIDAPLQAGMSGGPVIGENQTVRAIVHRDDTAAGGIAEAIQISEVVAVALAHRLQL